MSDTACIPQSSPCQHQRNFTQKETGLCYSTVAFSILADPFGIFSSLVSFYPLSLIQKSHLVLLSCRHHGADFARQIPLRFSLIRFLWPSAPSQAPSPSATSYSFSSIFLLPGTENLTSSRREEKPVGFPRPSRGMRRCWDAS